MYMLYLISVLGTNPRKSMELAEKYVLKVSRCSMYVRSTFMWRTANCSTKVSLRAYTLAGTHIAIAVPVDMIWYVLDRPVCTATFREGSYMENVGFLFTGFGRNKQTFQWQPRMKKMVCSCLSDITSARESRLKVIPKRALLSKPRPSNKGRRGGSSQKINVPLFLGRLSRHGRFEVSASWRVPWRKRNPFGFTKRGVWEMVA